MLTGLIMSGDTPVARFSGRAVTPILPSRAPLCFRNGGDLEVWLEMRAIDRHRTNSRILKRVLRLGDTSDLNTVLRVHGATITDNYWVKTDEEQDLCWEKVRFSQNYFADVALHGSFDSFSKQYTPEQLRTPTPELTNIGSYEKCWRLIDGKWVMLKQGSTGEIYSCLLYTSPLRCSPPNLESTLASEWRSTRSSTAVPLRQISRRVGSTSNPWPTSQGKTRSTRTITMR